MSLGFLYDANGNKSSKRLCGILAFGIGSLIGLFSVVTAIYHPLGDSKFIMEFIALCYGLAATMGVGSVFEKVKSLK